MGQNGSSSVWRRICTVQGKLHLSQERGIGLGSPDDADFPIVSVDVLCQILQGGVSEPCSRKLIIVFTERQAMNPEAQAPVGLNL